MKEPAEFQWCAERLRALADAGRLRLVVALLNGPKQVGELVDELAMPIAKVSHHLGVLRNVGITTATKKGRHVEYALHRDVFIVVDSDDPNAQIDLGCCCLELPVVTQEGRRQKD